MNILQIHNRYRYIGGEDAGVDVEAVVLREAGHDVHQFVQDNPASNVAAAGALLLAPWNPWAARLVGQVIDDVKPDAAHVHNTWFALSPSILRTLRKRGVPIVVTLHNYRLTCANALLLRNGQPCELCVGGNPWQAVRYACYRDSRIASIPAAATIQLHRQLGTWINDVDVFVVMTEVLRQVMIRAGLPPEKLVIMPHYVSDPGRRKTAPSESNVIVYAGRLSEEKGVHLLLDAWADAAPPGLELLIAGDGPERASLEQRLPRGARLAGHLNRTELARVMLESRALVMPSVWYETFGRVVIEAFAAGLPAAVSDGGAPAEIVTQNLGSQWVFPTRDRSALCHMLDTLADGDWCDYSGRVARQAFEKKFSRQHVAERLVQIYSSARTASPNVNRP